MWKKLYLKCLNRAPYRCNAVHTLLYSVALHGVLGKFHLNSFMGVCITLTTIMRIT